MWVWLDDLRPMPESFTHHARTAKEAIELLETNQVVLISLDYNLEDFKLNGYTVARFIERGACKGTLKRLAVFLHTADACGKLQMQQAIDKANQYWDLLEEKT